MSENNFLTDVRDRIRASLNAVGYSADGDSFADFPDDIAQVPAIYWVKKDGEGADTGETLTAAINLGKQLFLRHIDIDNVQHIYSLFYYVPNMQFLFGSIDKDTGLTLVKIYALNPDFDPEDPDSNRWVWEDIDINFDINAIKAKIPISASSTNQLADIAFVNSSITSMAANYVTKNTNGDPFDTVAQLQAATIFYHGGVQYTLSMNDYTIVSNDENHDNATSRYLYDGNQWTYQYSLNNSSFTQAQWNSINSGIVSGTVTSINAHLANTNIHVTTNEKENWISKNAAISGTITTANNSSVTGTVTAPVIKINNSIITNALGFTPMNSSNTVSIAQGGTGATAGQDAFNNLANEVSAGTETEEFKDDDYILTNYHSNGTTVPTVWRKRKTSNLLSYLRSQTLSMQTPPNIAATSATGTSLNFARADHVHSISKSTITSVLGVTIDKSVPSNALFTDTTYVAASTAAKAIATVAAAGSSTAYARYDHVHSISKSTITSVLGFTPASSDHTHNYLPLSGGTITGNLSVTTTTTANRSLIAKNSTWANGVGVLVSSNAGLYNNETDEWIINTNSASTLVRIPKWKSTGNSAKPVYFGADGYPIACAHGIFAGTSTPSTTVTSYAGCIYIKYS